VFGLWNHDLLTRLDVLYRDLTAPRVVTAPREAELVKYASNAFLATKISFVNELAGFCAEAEIDIDAVLRGVAHDPRMGHDFWRPGLGYGDSCLTKDVTALIRQARALGCPMDLLEAVSAVNKRQRLFPLPLIEASGPTPDVAVLGLLYEPGSDDMREAPSRDIVPALAAVAGRVRIWDPILPPEVSTELFPGILRMFKIEETVRDATVIVVLTEFPEVVQLDWAAVARDAVPGCLVIDGKNALQPQEITAAGLSYYGVGRPTSSHYVEVQDQ
jgi:UDPglucose 6-dehydrogenase